MKIQILLIFAALLFSNTSDGQSAIVRDIKSFGAKGDGKTNDHEAFMKAAEFFNKRGGNGKLVISPGTYIVGKQIYNPKTTTKHVYEGYQLLSFTHVKNMTIEGTTGSFIKFMNGLRFGSFDPKTGQPNNNGNNFFIGTHIASIGNAISFTNSSNIIIQNLDLNGNNGNFIVGATWGDVGIQLPHTGIQITNSTNVVIDNVKSHHFGLDGICVSNNTGNNKIPDVILIKNSAFEYNSRQGLSWVGGNDLTAINSKFNHTGKNKFYSPPGAGVDIEAEVGPVKNGKFIKCEFINNTGQGLVADSGPSSNCTFTDCIFWGTTNWSIWVTKPAFTFINSKIYGSIVHGYSASNDRDATKFINCLFEDKPYEGNEPYGGFLIETNYVKRMRFENCTLIAHKKKLFWMEIDPSLKPEEKYQFKNTKFFSGGKEISPKVFQPNPFVIFSN